MPTQSNEEGSAIQLIVGLGNPGAEYELTRHNVGFYLLDGLAEAYQAHWQFQKTWNAYVTDIVIGRSKVKLLKPQTFMNLSGLAVRAACQYLKLTAQSVLVICDDITIDFGKFKISTIPGSAGHNGIKNIIEQLGCGFSRYRIGVGGKKDANLPLNAFVTGKFFPEEQQYLPFVLQKFKKNLELLIDKGIIKGMNFIER